MSVTASSLQEAGAASSEFRTLVDTVCSIMEAPHHHTHHHPISLDPTNMPGNV